MTLPNPPGHQVVAPGQVIGSNWGNAVWNQSVQRFASDADRRNQYPTPAPGDVWYLRDIKVWQTFDGTNVTTLVTGISQSLANAAVTYSAQNAWVVMGPLSPAAGFGANPLLPVNPATTGVQIVVPGRYLAQASCLFSIAQLPRGVGVRKNAGPIAQSVDSGTQATWDASSPMELFDCVAGDVIEGVIFQNAAGQVTWNAGNQRMRVARVG